ncbi:MAG: hypothetical protein V3V32_02010 [Dehalococcoidia bacterium]
MLPLARLEAAYHFSQVAFSNRQKCSPYRDGNIKRGQRKANTPLWRARTREENTDFNVLPVAALPPDSEPSTFYEIIVAGVVLG